MYKVMIVEDELLVRVGLKTSIAWENYNMEVVAEAGNGEAAFEYFLKHKPEVVITDIKMPIMDGFDLIKKIRKYSNTTKIIILTCVEDFELAQKAIKYKIEDYILKLTMTPDEINAILERIYTDLKASSNNTLFSKNINYNTDDAFIGYLAYGTYTEKEIIDIYPFLANETSSLILLNIDEYWNLKKSLQDNKGNLIKFALINIIKDIFNKYTSCIVVQQNQNTYIAIIYGNIGISIKDMLMELRVVILNYFNTKISFVVSKNIFTIKDLAVRYKKASDCLPFLFFINSSYIDSETIFFNTIIEEVKDKTYAIGKDSLKSIVKEYFSKKINRESYINLFIQIYTEFYKSNINCTENISVFIKKINKANVYTDVIDIYAQSISNCEKRYSREIVKGIGYIKENYNKQIKLNEIADYVGLSPNYYSYLFKKETEISVFNYLNRYRINMSIQLLKYTNLKSYEVADKIGFKEESYFSRIFKRYTGKSPIEYRKILASDNNFIISQNYESEEADG